MEEGEEEKAAEEETEDGADEENPEEDAAEGGGDEAGEEGSAEGSISSSKRSFTQGSSIGSAESKSLSADIELLTSDVRELKDFVGVQYERLFATAKRGKSESFPTAIKIVEEKESLLERLQNPELIALLKQTFKRAERGSFSPRKFQKYEDYLEVLKGDCGKFETYLNDIGEALTNLQTYINSHGEDESQKEINYREVLERRNSKVNEINNLILKYVIKESCLDSYVFELDIANAYILVREQTDLIIKLKEYVELQREHIDPESKVFDEWAHLSSEHKNLDSRIEERLKTVNELENRYSNLEEEDKDSSLEKNVRKHMEGILRSQSDYIQKLNQCIEDQIPHIYEDDEIPDKGDIAIENDYISKNLSEWLMFNGFELNNPTKEACELEILSSAETEIEGLILELNNEIEELENQETDDEEREGLLDWLGNSDIKKEFLEKLVQELTDELVVIQKNKQTVERRALYGEKKSPGMKKPRIMPGMTEAGSVQSLNMPDSVPELKEFCKDLVRKYHCLYKVYLLRMNLNDEKRRQEKLRDEIDKVIESKYARKRGIQFEMQLRAAHATIADLKRILKENKKKATRKFEEYKGKLEEATEKQNQLREEILSYQSRMVVKAPETPATPRK